MVSDTKEALDVVESKINDVLEKVELNEKMENPILRLGKRETNFNNIYNTINFGKIKNRHSSLKSLSGETEKEITHITETIKSNLNREIQTQLSITPDKLKKLIQYEKYYVDNWMEYIDLDEIKTSTTQIKKLWQATQMMTSSYHALSNEYAIRFVETTLSTTEFSQLIMRFINDLAGIENKVKKEYNQLFFVKDIDSTNIQVIEQAIEEVEALKWPVINKLWFRGKEIKQIDFKLKDTFFNSIIPSVKEQGVQDTMQKELLLYKQLLKLNEKWMDNNIDFFEIAKEKQWSLILQYCQNILEAMKTIQAIASTIPKSFQLLRFDLNNTQTILHSRMVDCNGSDIEDLSDYIETYYSTLDGSIYSVGSSYIDERNQLQSRLIMKMTNILDESVVAFREKHKNDSEEIRRRVRAKKS